MYFKFTENDIFRQTVVANPKYNWMYVTPPSGDVDILLNYALKTGSLGLNIRNDSWNKTEINVNRPLTSVVYPFLDKTSGQLHFSNISSSTFNSLNFGANFTGTYFTEKTITRDYFTSTDNFAIKALQNIWNSQKKLNKAFDFENFPIEGSIHLIPRQYYHSTIKKGTVSAVVVTGVDSAADYAVNVRVAKDIYSDGVLRVVEDAMPTNHPSSTIGTEVGYILYDYGVVLFKSASLFRYRPATNNVELFNANNNFIWSSGSTSVYNWKWFGDQLFSYDDSGSRTYCYIEYEGVTKLEHLTLFCTAPNQKLNTSINPSFLEFGQNIYQTQSSQSTYSENNNLLINNIVSSSFNVEENFNKETYISEIYLFDEDKNLLATVKLANPVKKLENKDITIKSTIII